MVPHKPASLWTRAFALLCLAQFLGYAQHFMLTPTFPLYVTQLGGSPFVVGIVIASFAATSVVLRPVIGYWSDRWNEVGVMVSGLLLQSASILLCFIPMVEAIMVANALRGIGWAGMNTGGYSMLALAAPIERRGAASGYYSGIQASGTTLFPAVALWLLAAPFGGFAGVFATAAALALAAATIGLLMPGRRRGNTGPALISAGIWRRELVNLLEREVLLASALLFALHLSLPAVTSFLVLYAHDLRIEYFGWYFVVTGVVSLLARPLLGHFSDRIGYGRSATMAFAFQIAAFSVLMFASGLAAMLLAGVIYMMGNAIGGATTLALAMELAKPERRGRAMATYSLAFPLGNGVGALISGTVLDAASYTWMFAVAGMFAVIGLALTAANWQKLKPR